jgi:4'-phosphopantetheinyl transferase
MDVYWLEQTEADTPAENDWLSASEATRLNGMRFAKRRGDWRLGRWTAKLATVAYLSALGHRFLTLADCEIRSGPSGAPEVFVANKPAGVVISLSHRAGAALCLVAPSGTALGCDLEVIEPHSDAFIADYFTTEEQAMIARASVPDRPRLVTLLWSGKESALKALHMGLRLDTRCVVVTPVGALQSQNEDGEGCLQWESANRSTFTVRPLRVVNNWRPLRVRYIKGQIFHGWWEHTSNFLRTMVAAPPAARPMPLSITHCSAHTASMLGSAQYRTA